MDANIYKLYESDFYRVLDFKCRCVNHATSAPEHSNNFSISFVRKGNFLFNVFRNSLDSYTGCVLITKPFFERTVSHVHEVPDECTIFEFKDDFYSLLREQYDNTKFFNDNDIHSSLISTNIDTEFLHSLVMQSVIRKHTSKLLIDNLVVEIIGRTLSFITDYKPNMRIHSRMKKNHLQTIEAAKKYICENFAKDVSLTEIAKYCHISPFHFSRIFKTFTSYSPYKFLMLTRLKNAEILMTNTQTPITDIAFSSGFNSLENFTTAFHQVYKQSPVKYRAQHLGKNTRAEKIFANNISL